MHDDASLGQRHDDGRPDSHPPVDSGAAPDGPPASSPRSAGRLAKTAAHAHDGCGRCCFPVLVLLGPALVLALAPVAHLAARRLPLPPSDPTPIVAGATRPGTTAMRNVPVGLPADVTITSAQDVYPYAVAALGVLGAQELMAVLSSPDDLALYHGSTSPADFSYPYHYPALEPILDAAAEADLRRGATQLAAALIMLAGQPGLNSPAAYKAAPAAFGVLDRTRSSGGCDGQLDLLLLVAGDDFTTTRILADEQRRTVSACANEPTPDWIVGQAPNERLAAHLHAEAEPHRRQDAQGARSGNQYIPGTYRTVSARHGGRDRPR